MHPPATYRVVGVCNDGTQKHLATALLSSDQAERVRNVMIGSGKTADYSTLLIECESSMPNGAVVPP